MSPVALLGGLAVVAIFATALVPAWRMGLFSPAARAEEARRADRARAARGKRSRKDAGRSPEGWRAAGGCPGVLGHGPGSPATWGPWEASPPLPGPGPAGHDRKALADADQELADLRAAVSERMAAREALALTDEGLAKVLEAWS